MRPRDALRWLPAASWAAVITWISHQPSLEPPAGSPDWLAHMLEYGILGVAAAWALRGGRRPLEAGPLVALALGCALFGALDEVHPRFVPGRHADPRDVAADAGGALIALGLFALIQRAGPAGLPPAGGRKPRVVLYGRPGCHLCDEAEAILREVATEYGAEVVKVNVDEDEALSMRYGAQVPVAVVNGRKLFKLRADPARLRRRLESLGLRSRR